MVSRGYWSSVDWYLDNRNISDDKKKRIMAEKELTVEQKQKLIRLMMIRYGAATAGSVAGAILAYRQKQRFWGYVGYMLLGSIVVGGIATIALLPAAGKLVVEIEKGKTD